MTRKAICFVILLLGFVLPATLVSSETSKSNINQILDRAWEHFKNHRNFEGDWWSGRYKYPSMIGEDGRPNAFQDGGDVDNDAVKDINWQNPAVPYEIVVVSESASYALLRAVWMNDQASFNKIWKWTHDNLQRKNIKNVYYWWDAGSSKNGWKSVRELGLEQDNLFCWRWVPDVANSGKNGVMYYRWRLPEGKNNPNVPWRDGWDCAADADYDIALALIFADSQWGSVPGENPLNYGDHARAILNDLWDKTTVILGGKRFVAGGDNIDSVEPGYLSPASYRVFNDFDPTHDWQQLVASTYWGYKKSARAVLESWTDKTGVVHPQDPTGKVPPPNLIPDWFDVTSDGRVVDSSVRREPEFGTDAFRALWRIAMDKTWFNSREANDYLKGPDNPTEFFKWNLLERPSYPGIKDYDTRGKLAAIFWHDGAFCDYESNYEPELKDPARVSKLSGPRADSGAYGAYLAYFQAAGEKEAAQKVLEPLITPEANGYSKVDYVIPEDWLKKESPENLAKHVPQEKRKDPAAFVGKPFGPGDGWLCENSGGYYWTANDHSEWNAQGDYFSNTWAWLGLAMYSGKARNLFVSGQKEPVGGKGINIYSDNKFSRKIFQIIGQEKIYVELVGIDGNPGNRDWAYVVVSSSDKFSKSSDIKLKLAETGKHTGIYRGELKIGLTSMEAEATIGAAYDNQITIYHRSFPKAVGIYRVGMFNLVINLDNFNDNMLADSSALYWWQDGQNAAGVPVIAAGTETGVFIWQETDGWHLFFSAGEKPVKFIGTVSSDGAIKIKDSFLMAGGQKNQKIPIKIKDQSFSFDLDLKNDSAGVVFASSGNLLRFDIKKDGVYSPKEVYVGAARNYSYSLPLLLKNDNQNQTYSLSIDPAYNFQGFTALKVQKKYNQKDYPYFGAAGLKGVRGDWSDLDEYKMYVYLPEDVGLIQVDIEDEAGRVAMLNAFDPYRPEKGPGWYLWSSSNPNSLAAQREICDPRPIRLRDFWKGWDANLEKPMEIPGFDLKHIRNIQFSVGGGEKKDVTVYFARMVLIRPNYHLGDSDPQKINQINFYQDADYHEPFEKKSELTSSRIFVEVTGIDRDPVAVDRFRLKVCSDDAYPGCDGINLFLTETGKNTGIYRGMLKIGLASDYLTNQIGATEGSTVFVFSELEPDVKAGIKIGARKIVDNIDDFSDGIIFDDNPVTWWTDDHDPSTGQPVYVAGRDLGYFIWRNGTVWNLRWSGDGQKHVFSGSIKSDGPVTLNYQGPGKVSVKTSGKEIIFSGQNSDTEDGFTFEGSGTYFIFDIKIDGRYYGRQAWVGRIPYKKAYDLPFTLKNKGITKSYQLSSSFPGRLPKSFAMRVEKIYNGIKEYPYFGAWWGFTPELFDWTNVEELKMWIYLPEDVGDIRADVEDKNGRVVIVNGYNPWEPERGPGWYLWHSSFKDSLEVVRGNVEPVAVKDRHWWKSWSENLKNPELRPGDFDLKNVINLQISVGGGLKKNADIMLGQVYLVKENNHIGFNNPRKIDYILPYLDEDFKISAGPSGEVAQEDVYLELKGQDADSATVDRVKLLVEPEDNFAGCNPINIYLIETSKNSGIFRGHFKIGLASNQEEFMVGASRDSHLKIFSPAFKDQILDLKVGAFTYKYILDNFDDGKITDEMPLVWWTDEVNPEGQPEYEIGRDLGYFIWRTGDTWHLRWLADVKKHSFSGLLATAGQLEKVTAVNPGPEFTFEESRNTVNFSSSLTSAEAGFDFMVKGGRDSFLYFVNKIDGVSQGKMVFVGEKRSLAYALPFTLFSSGTTKHYQLTASKEVAKSGKYSMKVVRSFGIKDYPYFGAWGLKSPLSDWSGVDELSFWIYLKTDPGEVRVDIEDGQGETAVLNGYNPWNPDKGEGWYLWRSNNQLAWQAREGNCQPVPIKDRTFWKKWSVEKFDYADNTGRINLKNIVNVQFVIGGRETGIEFETLGTYQKSDLRDITCFIDDISLTRANFHLADILPKDIKNIDFYSDVGFKDKISPAAAARAQEVFVQARGQDASPFSVDRIPLEINSDSKGPGVFPVTVKLTETGRNTGVFGGRFRIDLSSLKEEGTIGAVYKSKIAARVPAVNSGFRAILNVGKMTYKYPIEDFSDGSISDRVPVTWWTDDLDPEDTPEYKAGTDLGYFVWRDMKGWHVRWSSDGKKHSFQGSIICVENNPAPDSADGKKSKPEKTKEVFGFANVKTFSFDKGTMFEQANDELNFKEVRTQGEAGFDFICRETEYVQFDLRIDDKYLGRQTYVGGTGTRVYSLPFALYYKGLTKNIWLGISRQAPPGLEYSLGVRKVTHIKDYPTFGLWGLKKKVNDLSDWSRVDRMKCLLYLPANFGSLTTRVEIEDTSGHVAILNGYDPTAFGEKSPNDWYLWDSSFSTGPDVEAKIVSPTNIPLRKFWKKWDLETNRRYIDVTSEIDIKNIVNMSFSVGGGTGEDVTFNVGPIWLEKDNF